ncbi:MAG: iron-sulfur cluster-binding domain-containing protein [Clostridia bacterium]|nr:iron-sulfur cluster-binding domain-containing protein [Clostridia bacterium]
MDKKLNVKIKPIGLLDIIAFSKMVKKRTQKINAAKTTPIIPSEVNKNALLLHPKTQFMKISEIIPESPKVKTFVLRMSGGGSPAFFRAGQYVSLRLRIGDSVFTRPYSISSSPNDSLKGFYSISIKGTDEGFFSKWALDNWKEGDSIEVSSPEGNFYYEPIRDARFVTGICGGSGVTPFLSMAKAIAEGEEDFNLTLLYGSCKECDILFKNEFERLEKLANGKLKIVYVLSDEKKDNFENGFITSTLIKKYSAKDSPYSVFICGPQAMYNFVSKEISSLNIPQKYVRRELFGEVKRIEMVNGYPVEHLNKFYQLKVNYFGGNTQIIANSNDSILVSLEKSGIIAPSKCRSGECGFCRSKLISGEVFIVPDGDGRRAADKKLGFIHICSSYPISDLEIELPR